MTTTLTTTPNSSLDELLSKQAIREVVLRYLRGIDRLDAELINSAFHPDAVDEHGGHSWQGEGIGETIVGLIRDVGFHRSMHFLGNQVIEVTGDVGYSESTVLAHLLSSDEAGEYVLRRPLRYIDEFHRRDNQWRIRHRRTIREWDRVYRDAERSTRTGYVEPHRSRADISYERATQPFVADDQSSGAT